MANKGAQYSAALQVTANIQGNISKTMEAGVKQAQAGVRRGVQSGARGGAQESSKGKRRFGNMMFEASRAAEDFGQQLSVSFDQAVRASANNITQMVAVSGNQYAAMATSVAVALYFMLDPIKELVGFTRQWASELETVEGRIRGVKDALSKGMELREFEQALVAGLTPEDKRPDQWQTQKTNLEEQLGDLKARQAAINKFRKETFDEQKHWRDPVLLVPAVAGQEGGHLKDRAALEEESRFMMKMSSLSEEQLGRMVTMQKRYSASFRPDIPELTTTALDKKTAEEGRAEWNAFLQEMGLFPSNTSQKFGVLNDPTKAIIPERFGRMDPMEQSGTHSLQVWGDLIEELKEPGDVMKVLQKEGREAVKLAEEQALIQEKLNIREKHSEAIAKKRLQLDRDRLDTMRSMSNLAQEGSKAEMDVLRRINLSGYGGGPGAFSRDPVGLVAPPRRDDFGQFSGLRRTPDGRLVSGGMRGGGGDAFSKRAHWIASGIGGAGFGKSKRRRKTAEELAALGIGPRKPRTAREWRGLGVRHESVGWGPGQGAGVMIHDPRVRDSQWGFSTQQGIDEEIIKGSPWERMPALGWGARGGRGTTESPGYGILSGWMHGPEEWANRRSKGPLRKTGLTEREKRRFRASRGGGTASDIVNRLPMRIIEQAFGAGAAGVSKWMDSTEFWQGGDRGAAFVPGYPGSRAGSIGTHPSSPGMTPSQSRLLDSFWTGSGYQRSRYGADADLDVQRGADSQLDADHPVMSPKDQLKRDRNFEVEEQSSQYLKSIADDTREMARERKPKIVHIPGGP
jgi:hypothetical protein